MNSSTSLLDYNLNKIYDRIFVFWFALCDFKKKTRCLKICWKGNVENQTKMTSDHWSVSDIVS